MEEQTSLIAPIQSLTGTDRAVKALTMQYASRGLALTAVREAENQDRRDLTLFEQMPEAYRLSGESDSGVREKYRHGKEHMSGEDLLEYISDSRKMRAETYKGTELTLRSTNEIAEIAGQTVCTYQRPSVGFFSKVGTGIAGFLGSVRKNVPAWFDASEEESPAAKRRFPVSAFASIAAIALVLMLIVSGTMMVSRAQTDVNDLQTRITVLSSDVREMKNEFESVNDRDGIREIALQNYGVTEEDFLRTDTVTLDAAEEIEVYEPEEEKNIGLSALLSALGIKK